MANDSDNIRLILDAVNRASGELEAADKAVKKLTASTEVHNQVAKQSDTIQKRLGAVVQANQRTFLVAAAAATAAATAFALMGKHAIDGAEALLDMSKKTGVSVEQLSTLVLVAEEAGSSAQGLQTAFKEQAKAAIESTKANSAAAIAYDLLGVNARDAAGNLKEPLALMLETADGLNRIEDASLRSAIAQNIYGKSALDLLPTLSAGSAGIKQQQALYESFGAQISTKTARQADEFNDKLKQVQEVTKAAAKQLAVALLPTLIQVNDFLIKNAASVQFFAKGLFAAVTAVTTAAVGFKAFSITSQLLTAAFGLGPLKNLRDYGAAIQLVAGTKMGALTIGVASLTAVVFAGIEGWKAYQAAKVAATSASDLNASQIEFRARIEDQIFVTQKLGRITVEEAERMKAALAQTFDSDDAGLQARAIESVSRELRIAQGVTQGGPGKAGAGLSLIESPELAKAKLDANLAQIKAAQGLAQSEAARTIQTEDRALEQQLKNRTITVDQFEAKRFELVQQRLDRELAAQNQVFDAERAALVKQQEDIANRVKNTTAEQKLADPGAIAAAEQEQVAINSRIEVLEIDHQAKLQEIRAASEGQVNAVEDQVDQKRQERAAQEIKFNADRAASQVAILDGQAKEYENAARMVEIMNSRIETEGAATEAEALRLSGADVNQQAQVLAEQAAFDQKIANLELLQIATDERNVLAEDAERVHQENLLLIAQDTSNRKAEIEASTQAKIQQIRDGQLRGAQNLFNNLAAVTESGNKEGFTAYKAFASASALIDTYKSAQAAYSSVAGIPFVGPALAVAAAAAAIAAGLSNVAKINSLSFAEGGLVPGAPSSRDNRVANVATGEYIFDARSVQSMGPRWFAGVHAAIQNKDYGSIGAMSRPRSVSGFAAGGLVGEDPEAAIGRTDGTSVTIGTLNSRNQQRDFLRQEGVKVIMDALSGRGNPVVA